MRLRAHLDPSIHHPDFLFLDGRIDDLTPWVSLGGHGTVSGIPNFAPNACTRLWTLLQKQSMTEAEKQEAADIQTVASKADVAAIPGGIRAMSGHEVRSPLLS